jgi:hypothetical protein
LYEEHILEEKLSLSFSRNLLLKALYTKIEGGPFELKEDDFNLLRLIHE